MIHQLDINQWDPTVNLNLQELALSHLEQDGIVYLPSLRFDILQNEFALFSPEHTSPSTKNISYHLKTGSLRGLKSLELQKDFNIMMKRYAEFSLQLIKQLLPSYYPQLKIGRTSFRTIEIKGRKPRSYTQDDTRLHVDAFPSTPCQGERIFRVFSNVNPHSQPRVWNIGESFETVAQQFIPAIKKQMVGSAQLLKMLSITKSLRTPYDHLMLQMHNRMKKDMNYQNKVDKKEIHFPSGSSWLVFTDKVSHAALSGQYAFEQTFYLPVNAMSNPELSPLKILEKMTSQQLA